MSLTSPFSLSCSPIDSQNDAGTVPNKIPARSASFGGSFIEFYPVLVGHQHVRLTQVRSITYRLIAVRFWGLASSFIDIVVLDMCLVVWIGSCVSFGIENSLSRCLYVSVLVSDQKQTKSVKKNSAHILPLLKKPKSGLF